MGAAGGGGGTSSPPAPCPSRSPLHRVSSQGRFHFRVQLGGCSEGAWLCRKPFPLLPSAELPRSPLRGIRAAAARRSTKKRQFLMSASVLAAVTQKPPSLRGQSLPEPPPIPVRSFSRSRSEEMAAAVTASGEFRFPFLAVLPTARRTPVIEEPQVFSEASSSKFDARCAPSGLRGAGGACGNAAAAT